MAQIAKPAAEKAEDTVKDATDHAVEQGKRTAEQGGAVAREAAERTGDMARHGLQVAQRTAEAAGELQREVAQRSTEHTSELGRVLVDLVQEQTRHNLKTLAALAGAVDWDQVAKAVDWDRVRRIQAEYLRVSLERGAQLTRRYLEASQAVMTATADAAGKQARKAA
jgi:hypothetical protein